MSDLVIAIDARLVAGSSTGDSAYWTGLLHGLTRISGDARFLLYSNAEQPPTIPLSDRFRWITLPSRTSRWWSLVAFPLAARRQHAIVHTQYNLSPLARRRSVTTVHDVSFFIGPEWFKPRDRLLLRRFVPASVRRAGRVVTVSETSRGEIERYIPEAIGKVSVTPLACPVHIRPTATAAVPSSITPPYLLTVGTRWPRKNMSLAIEAAALAGQSLVITGKPGWGDERLLGKVQMPGFVDGDTLSALYREAAIYLAPSFHEGFGLPLLEAFTCGCPVICGHGGALPEVAGDAAIVMRNWEAADWAAVIRDLTADSSKLIDLRRRGHARAAQFSWEKTAQLTMDVYEQVAMEHPA